MTSPIAEALRIKAEAKAATLQIQSAKTIGEIVQIKQISVPAYLKTTVRSALRHLEIAAESRAEELTREQIDLIGRCARRQEGQTLKEKYLSSEWKALSGHFPGVLYRATRDADITIQQLPE